MGDDEWQARYEAIGDQLRSKIQSKFQATTFLGGFCLSLLGIVTSILWGGDGPALLPISLALLAFACVLFLNAVRAFDELAMPKRFWEERNTNDDKTEPRTGYLTDDNLWTLRNVMIFFWNRCVVVAVPATGLALLLLFVPLSAGIVSADVLWALLGAGGGTTSALVYCFVVERVREHRFPELVRPND